MVRLVLLLSALSLPAFADNYLVAAKDLPAGTTLTMEALSQKRSGARVTGALTSDRASRVVNQRLRFALKKGELLMEFALGPASKAGERCAQAP